MYEKNLTREEAIWEACSIVALAYDSIGHYMEASDGFCDECMELHGTSDYQNHGRALKYVLKQLKADGYKIDHNFDSETGEELRSKS